MTNIMKNIFIGGLIVFIFGIFNPIVNASYFESEAILSTEAVEEIREAALKNKKVLAVETEGIQNLDVKEGYISLEVVREGDTAILNIPNSELSEKTIMEINSIREENRPKVNDTEKNQDLTYQELGLLVLLAFVIFGSVYIWLREDQSTSDKMSALLIISFVAFVFVMIIGDRL